MKTKIKGVIAFGMLSAASLTILFALPTQQPNSNAWAESVVTVPSTVSSSSDNGGMRTRAGTVLPSARYGWQVDPNAASATLEALDIRSVTMNAPNQIGVNRSVAVSPKTRPQKFVNPDGSQTIVVIVKSSGASGIGVHFRNFALAAGDEVYVYGPAADSVVFGPFTNKGPWASGEFWSGTVVGDTAVVEFHTRTDEKGFEIFEISHIFPERDWRLQSAQPDILICEVDASCSGDIQKNAVGRITFNNNGPYVCTGTLLNDAAQDHIPYFLTANHCVPTQAVAQTVEVYWFYQTTGCNSGVLRNWVHSPPGATLLATQSSNDFALLRLQNNAPAGAVFSGWTAAAQSTGTGVFGLHHPGPGIPPYLASFLRRASGTITFTNDYCPATGLQSGYGIDWTSGATEPGASGSGLWNSNGQLVGVLSCGPVLGSCNSQYAEYSKFANFYSQIQQYLGSGAPTPTPKSDFNRDGKPDYLLYNPGTRQTAVWYLNNNVYLGWATAPPPPVGWRVIDAADFNRDGRPDYALFNASTRQTAIWYLSGPNGVTFIGGANGPTAPSGWAPVATGDFNNDGKPDGVLYNASTRQTAISYLNNNIYIGDAYGPTLPAGWNLVGIADFNRDGKRDYLLFNPSTRGTAIWYLNNNVRIGTAFGPAIAAGYQLIGVADFNRDGKPDYLLFNPSTRGTAIWYLNNNVYIGVASGPTLPVGWTVAAP